MNIKEIMNRITEINDEIEKRNASLKQEQNFLYFAIDEVFQHDVWDFDVNFIHENCLSVYAKKYEDIEKYKHYYDEIPNAHFYIENNIATLNECLYSDVNWQEAQKILNDLLDRNFSTEGRRRNKRKLSEILADMCEISYGIEQARIKLSDELTLTHKGCEYEFCLHITHQHPQISVWAVYDNPSNAARFELRDDSIKVLKTGQYTIRCSELLDMIQKILDRDMED